MTTTSRFSRITELERRFNDIYDRDPEFIVRAPGRVNLIGEHTDYNDGFVFPAAIDRDVYIAGSLRSDRQVKAYALNFNYACSFSLDDIRLISEGREKWSNYLRAMAFILQNQELEVRGMNCAVLGDVPLGAGQIGRAHV